LLPVLAAEGGNARSLARLATRLARANAAVEVLADGAERYLALKGRGAVQSVRNAAVFDAAAFASLPEEVRLRLLMRAINRFGHEGPAELGKLEALLGQLDRRVSGTSLRQTLAGALVSLKAGRICIESAPARRRPPR
jgi:tRNA(Ile)-lysidine synthase